MEKQFTMSMFASKKDLEAAKAEYVATNRAVATAFGYETFACDKGYAFAKVGSAVFLDGFETPDDAWEAAANEAIISVPSLDPESVCERLLRPESYAGIHGVPDVAKDAVTLIREFAAKMEANQQPVSEFKRGDKIYFGKGPLVVIGVVIGTRPGIVDVRGVEMGFEHSHCKRISIGTTPAPGATLGKISDKQFLDHIKAEPAFGGRPYVRVNAEVHSDDLVHQVDFDAESYLCQASDEQIQNLIKCGWGGAEPADRVAEFFQNKNQEIGALFKYLDSIQGLRSHKDMCGFECHVNEDDAMKWVVNNRPHLVPENSTHRSPRMR